MLLIDNIKAGLAAMYGRLTGENGRAALGLNNHQLVQVDSGGRITHSFGAVWRAGAQIGSTPYAGMYGTVISYLANRVAGSWVSTGGGTAGAITIDEGAFSFASSQSVANVGSALTWTTRLAVLPSGRTLISTTDDGTSALQVGGAIVHGTDNAWAYGSAARRGTTIYLATNPVVGSDARLKCDYSVIPGDIAHELLLKIVPRVGKFIVGGQEAYEVEVTTTNEAGEEVTQKVTRYREVPGNRYHTYYLAQEVKAALDSVADRWPQASNFALWLLSDVEDVDSIQMIRYEQMIPIIHAASNYRYGALA